MKVLAVDTSSAVAAAAVMEDGKLLGEYSINHKKTHSQKLMPMIRELLKSLELTPSHMDVFAASIGPGSFTGLRIGVTTIKAMAYAAGKPVAGINTLDALAYNIPLAEALVCPIMDARNSQVFTAVYSTEKGEPEKLTDYMGIPVMELISIIRQKNKKVIFLGDGVEIHKDLLQRELGSSCMFSPVSLNMQRASSVAQIAFKHAEKGFLQSSFDLVPFYLRKSQAERMKEAKNR